MSDEASEVPDWWRPYAADFPAWHAWRGVNSLYYARIPRTSPSIVVERAEDPEDLRDMIKRKQSDLYERDYGRRPQGM